MLPAIFGLAGVLIGIFIGEFFRRKSRIEIFTKEIFLRRLQIFENLYQLFLEAEKLSFSLEEIDDKDLVTESWTEVVFKISDYMDTNYIYIDEEIIAHCMMTLIGFDDLLFDDQRQVLLDEFRSKFKETKVLIRNVSGISATEKTIRNVANIELSTENIKYYRKLKKKYNKNQKSKNTM
ncbi:hypothetical protein [Paenibacillus phocaensis]|uniref:hypothetical protein n=1 Tax=Paenibacillus phocaensis TaxID=1776378 RepID=UPI000839B603|nr:hypothetical protein [Paenibacillus phocaensis]